MNEFESLSRDLDFINNGRRGYHMPEFNIIEMDMYYIITAAYQIMNGASDDIIVLTSTRGGGEKIYYID